MGSEMCIRDRPGIDYGDQGRSGTAGVKVGAEVIVPDMHLLELLLANRDMEARRYWRSRQSKGFCDPDMDGKEAWGHVLYDISQGRVDPYYFDRLFGSATVLAESMNRS